MPPITSSLALFLSGIVVYTALVLHGTYRSFPNIYHRPTRHLHLRCEISSMLARLKAAIATLREVYTLFNCTILLILCPFVPDSSSHAFTSTPIHNRSLAICSIIFTAPRSTTHFFRRPNANYRLGQCLAATHVYTRRLAAYH